MSRSKPYARDSAKRDADAPWKHDMYDRSNSLAARLSTSGRVSPASRSPSGSAGLLGRLSGKGQELIIDTSTPTTSKLFGFSTPSSAGPRELLPGKSARTPRSSRPRGGDRGAESRLVAASLGSLSPAPISIMGAAGVRVRVENLARGTTAEDVKSAFAPTPILAAALAPGGRDSATVNVDVADREAAQVLIDKFDGVVADGMALRLTIVRGDGRGDARGDTGRGRNGNGAGRSVSGNGNGNGNGGRREQKSQGHGQGLGARLNSPREQPSGKMYSDSVKSVRSDPRGEPSLAARLGRR